MSCKCGSGLACRNQSQSHLPAIDFRRDATWKPKFSGRHVGDAPVEMHLAGRDDSDLVTEIAAGTAIEVLDIAGEWAWVCLTPEGPSGYVRIAQLAPVDA